MKFRRSKYIRVIRANVCQGIVCFQDRFGPFVESLLVAVVGIAFLTIAVLLGIGTLDDWAAFAGGIALAVIVTFFLRRAARQHAILIEVTMSYLIHGGKSLLDNLLGKLIGGRWRREQLKPGDALFDVLEEVSHGDDWEMKRRVAEALPALGEVDSGRTMKLVGILREDWEPTKWESDLRRRAVEALVISARPGGVPLLDRVKPERVIPLLRLRDKDGVYVAMAVARALREWEDTRPKIAGELRSDLLEFSTKTFPEEEKAAINDLLELLKISRDGNIWALLEKFEQMSASPNVFARVAAARNVLLLSERFPGKTLDFMLSFLEPSQHKNVRRPIAREQSVEFVVQMLASQAHRTKAEDILWKLLADTDEIIRIGAFDKAETLRERDRELLTKVCDFILANDTSQILLERAKRLKEDLSGGS